MESTLGWVSQKQACSLLLFCPVGWRRKFAVHGWARLQPAFPRLKGLVSTCTNLENVLVRKGPIDAVDVPLARFNNIEACPSSLLAIELQAALKAVSKASKASLEGFLCGTSAP